jgi:hypothetical protein
MKNGPSGAAEKVRTVILVGGLCFALCFLLVDRRAHRIAERSHSDAVGERAELPE